MADLFLETMEPQKEREGGLEIRGTVERLTFRNEENGYTVLRFMTEEEQVVVATGKFAAIAEGDSLALVGRWVDNPKYGRQFEVATYRPSLPGTLKGMERYLASGRVPGIGPHYAKKIIRHFGEQIFSVMEKNPERLKEVPGIGEKRAKSAAEAIRNDLAVQNLMVFLGEFDVSSTLAIKIYKEYGDDAFRVLKENPYALADDIFGVGFKTADSVARKMGMPASDPRRHRAGLVYVLQQARDDGHCYLPRLELQRTASELLESDFNAVGTALEELTTDGPLVNDSDRIYLDSLYRAEEYVARRLAELSSRKKKPYDRKQFAGMLEQIQRIENLSLAPDQLRAVEAAYENQCVVITGGPGTGKSTTVRIIVRMFERLGRTTRLASPTGRAAKRLEEATGRPASTIHRLLEYKPNTGFTRNADQPLDCRVVVIDETSMVDIPLAYYLLRALPPGCRLVLVGDVDQLPSVGPGNLLKDIIDSGVITTVKLTEIFRQARGSMIVTNAHRINQGQMPLLDPPAGEKDFDWQKEEVRDAIGDRVVELITTRLSRRFDPRTQIQVLTPMHAGPAGARELNRRLQQTCNPPAPGKLELRHGDRLFRTGDRVMQTKNNYELDVFNGDVGTISQIDPREGTLTVEYDKPVTYRRSDLDQLQLAYAITVHKSQGSEYPCVVIPMSTSHWVMLQRNLLYTAVTRAKKYCVVVGQRQALGRAVSNAHTSQRYTHLRERLKSFRFCVPEKTV